MRSLPAATEPSRGYFDQLTAIRGWACLAVLLGHVVQVVNYGPVDGIIQRKGLHGFIIAIFNAEGAVLLFFVLSGCVLSMSLAQAGRLDWRALAGFYVRRVFRLYPLIWLATFVAIAGVLAARPLVSNGDFVQSWVTQDVESSITPLHTLLSLLGVWTRYDGPLWSLRVELIYSALFPVIYILVRNQRTRVWIIAALLALALVPVPEPQFGTPFGFCFALGALVPLLPRAAARPPVPVVLAALVLLCYDRCMLQFFNPPDIVFDLIETMASVVIVRHVYASGIRHRLLTARFATWAGERSFSIYLLHLPVLFLIMAILQRFIDLTPLLAYTSILQIALGLATVSVTISVSAFTYRFVELPLHNIGRRLARRIATGPAAMAETGGSPVATATRAA